VPGDFGVRAIADLVRENRRTHARFDWLGQDVDALLRSASALIRAVGQLVEGEDDSEVCDCGFDAPGRLSLLKLA
jgi:hypothetical protein